MLTNKTALRTAALCCLLLATKATHGGGGRRNGGWNGGNGGFGNNGWRSKVKADTEKAKAEGQTGPDPQKPDRGVGRPEANENVIRFGDVLSGTWDSWHVQGKMCGSAQIMPNPARTTELRPTFAWWEDQQSKPAADGSIGGVHLLHPLLPGQKVKFRVVVGDKPWQVKAIDVERVLETPLPMGLPQADVNLFANQQHLSRRVGQTLSPNINTDYFASLQKLIGSLTEKLLHEKAGELPRIDVKFQKKHEEIIQLAKDMKPEENDMNEKLIEQALKQIFAEFVRRGTMGEISPASSSGVASSPGRASPSPAVQQAAAAASSPPVGVSFVAEPDVRATPQFGHATPAAVKPTDAMKKMADVRSAVAAKLASHRSEASASATTEQPKPSAKPTKKSVGMEDTVEHIHIFPASAEASPTPSGTNSPYRSSSPGPAVELTRPEDAVASYMHAASTPAVTPAAMDVDDDVKSQSSQE